MVQFRRLIRRVQNRPFVKAAQCLRPQSTLRWNSLIQTTEACFGFFHSASIPRQPAIRNSLSSRGRGSRSRWTRSAAEAERPVARRATHLCHCSRRCAIALPVSADQCAIVAKTACAKKLILQDASNGSPLSSPCAYRKSNPDIFVIAIRRGPGGTEYVLPSLRCAIGEHPCPKPSACASHYSSERKISESGVDVPRLRQ